ncbi:recombinase [Pseudomonas sp. LTJR-52]|nr:recombinase [Pseudomonas sp. LTJR-52]
MKLAEVQKQLHAPKSQENKFGGYKYRSCEDILQAVKPLLGEMVIVITDEIVMVADRIYVKATATLTDGESSISTSAFAREALTKKGQDESQITGSASSYARKYALNGLLLIDDNKDADSQDNRTSGHPINKQQLNKLEAVLNSCSPKVQAKFEKDYPDATKIMADAFDSLIFALEGAARKYQDHLSQQNAA